MSAAERQPIPVGTTRTVDTATGEETESAGGMFLLPAAPGTCELCAVKHDPAEPHNAQSMFYQMRFHGEHGRWPTWTDAMAHCSPEVRARWRGELVKLMTAKGMEVPADLKGQP